MKHLLRPLCLAVLAWLPLVARAFPPAPHHLIYGLVRDEYGIPVMNPGAKVLLIAANGSTVSTTVVPGLALGINYALEVPMDFGIAPGLYKANAQQRGAGYRLAVVVGAVTNTPLEMTGGLQVLGKPAEQTRWDLTLGEDTNGNHIPDAWERAFLAMAGLDLDLATLRADRDYTGSGRTLLAEYQLGGEAPDPDGEFRVTLLDRNDGAPVLGLTTKADRTYSVQGSSDLRQWMPLSFKIPALDPTAIHSAYTAPDTRTLQLQVVLPDPDVSVQFFRLGSQ